MTENALAFMRRLREGLDAGLDLPEAIARAATALPRDARATVERLLERMDGDYTEDEWGFDEEFADLVEPFFGFLYDTWWRVRVEGAERVPAHGRALLAANHAGILPWDATMISMALLREHPLPRHPRFLVLNWAFDLPWVSTAIRRSAASSPRPTTRCGCSSRTSSWRSSPRASRAPASPISERYRLQRFGRGGFVEIALRAGRSDRAGGGRRSEEIYPSSPTCRRSRG